MAHNDDGEDHFDPEPRLVETRAPDVIWTPVSGKGGLTFKDNGTRTLVIHTTETQGLPTYPYPPHLTIDLEAPDRIWQHVTLDKGAYALKSADQSPNYECGVVYQVEHIAYAKDSPGAPDLFYQSLAREIVWFHQNKGVPLEFHEPFVGGEGYGDWPGRMTAAEFTAFSGICGHQHVHSPNAHWDPGALDMNRLWGFIDNLMAPVEPVEPIEPPEEEDWLMSINERSRAALEAMSPRAMEAMCESWSYLVDNPPDGEAGSETTMWNTTRFYRVVADRSGRPRSNPDQVANQVELKPKP